jgi:hypothetical protein
MFNTNIIRFIYYKHGIRSALRSSIELEPAIAADRLSTNGFRDHTGLPHNHVLSFYQEALSAAQAKRDDTYFTLNPRELDVHSYTNGK